jgi:diguanylate cyclase (GGDEF)-like protein/PAS domain S-box-containing protein
MTAEETTGLERLIESLGDACLVLAEDGTIVALNRRAEELYGAERAELMGRHLGEMCAATDRCVVECALDGCRDQDRDFTATQVRVDDGHSFVGEFTVSRRRFDTVDCERLVLVVRELERHLDACREDLELHHLLLEHSLDGIMAYTLEGELLFANTAAQQQWCMTVDEIRTRGPWGWVATADQKAIPTRVSQLLEHGRARFESHSQLPNGHKSHQEIHARLVHSEHGPIVVATIRDISERMQAEEMVRYLAYHDMLTGVANRVMLDQELSQAISSAERHGDIVGVVFIDLDDFKPVNDTYGHIIGDQVLRDVAKRIMHSVREYDTVARLGGDEFVVVLPRLPRPETLETVARKLVASVAEPLAVGGADIRVTASVGLALYHKGDDVNTLLTRADLNMYEARDRRRTVSHGE